MQEFDALDPALRFLDAHPGRYVLKWNGSGFGAYDNYVGRLPDGRDVRALLAAKFRSSAGSGSPSCSWSGSRAWRWASALFRRRALPASRLPRLGAQALLSRRPRRADGRDGHSGHL
jgi:hypothetical protein